jgi:hypothetical protein
MIAESKTVTEQTATTEGQSIQAVTEEGRQLVKLLDERLHIRVELIKQQVIIIRAVARAIENANPINHVMDIPDYVKLEEKLKDDVKDYETIESLIGDLLDRFGLKICT